MQNTLPQTHKNYQPKIFHIPSDLLQYWCSVLQPFFDRGNISAKRDKVFLNLLLICARTIAWFWWWATVGILINAFLWNYLQWNEYPSALNMDITFLLNWKWITFLWMWGSWCRDKKGCGLAHICWVYGLWTILLLTRTRQFFNISSLNIFHGKTSNT